MAVFLQATRPLTATLTSSANFVQFFCPATLVTVLLVLVAVTGSTVVMVLLSGRGTRDCEVAALPLIIAVERYRQLNGRYPEALELLIAQRLLPSMPAPPSNARVLRGGFDYFKDDELDFFCISYTEQDIFAGLGPARVWERAYVSFEDAWFREGQAPQVDFPHRLGLSMTRAGRRYRLAGPLRIWTYLSRI
jgi:hypothetical protein